MKIYRAMIPAADGLPAIGRSARQLGVGAKDRAPNHDVNALGPGDLVASSEGMSAAPDDAANLPKNRRPPQVNGGVGKDPVWEIDTGELGDLLKYVQDSPTHGVVGPKAPMTLDEFERALAATREKWVRVIG